LPSPKATAEHGEGAARTFGAAISPPSAVASFGWLVAKEYRELVSSRAWWILLLAMGPLVGVTFISAVRTYGEASGLNGTTGGVGEAFSPLIGIWAPTFSACEVAAVFLLPFVAIRLVSGDRQSGALKIEMQHPIPAIARVGAKAVVLMGGWLVASLAPLAAALLWKSYGGSVFAPELMTVAFGHTLNAGLTIALASAAAALTEHPSTAAILTLSATVGAWVLNFIAAVQGGIWERLAGYTPPAMVAQFQRGLIRLDVVLIALTLVATGLMFAAIWLRLGLPVRRRCWSCSPAARYGQAGISPRTG
jgi:ABC-2 type transport system permease protein